GMVEYRRPAGGADADLGHGQDSVLVQDRPSLDAQAVATIDEVAVTGAKILMVDDDQATVDLVRLYLEREQHEVSVAYDGRTALELATSQQCDHIVLYWLLPCLDGLT